MRRFAIVVVCGCWTSSQQPPDPVTAHETPAKPASPPVERWDRSTPRGALYAFVRAVEQERYDIVLRFAPAAYRDRLTEEKIREQFSRASTRKQLDQLRDDLDAPIRESGDRATMSYGDRFEVELVLEDGAWCVADLD